MIHPLFSQVVLPNAIVEVETSEGDTSRVMILDLFLGVKYKYLFFYSQNKLLLNLLERLNFKRLNKIEAIK